MWLYDGGATSTYSWPPNLSTSPVSRERSSYYPAPVFQSWHLYVSQHFLGKINRQTIDIMELTARSNRSTVVWISQQSPGPVHDNWASSPSVRFFFTLAFQLDQGRFQYLLGAARAYNECRRRLNHRATDTHQHREEAGVAFWAASQDQKYLAGVRGTASSVLEYATS